MVFCAAPHQGAAALGCAPPVCAGVCASWITALAMRLGWERQLHVVLCCVCGIWQPLGDGREGRGWSRVRLQHAALLIGRSRGWRCGWRRCSCSSMLRQNLSTVLFYPLERMVFFLLLCADGRTLPLTILLCTEPRLLACDSCCSGSLKIPCTR